MKSRAMPLWGLALLVLSQTLLSGEVRAPGPGEKGSGSASVLFLMGQGFNSLDPAVAKRFAERGYACDVVSDKEPLTADFLRQFNAVVLSGLDDFNSGRYYAPGGIHLLNTASTVKLLHAYVAEGGGLVVVPLMQEAGSQVASTYAEALAPWKVSVGWETVRDDAHRLDDPKNPGKKLEYAWTRNVADHPLTRGVKALAYATQVMRWDDAYPTVPILPAESAWQVLVRAEKTAQGMRSVGYGKWAPGDAGDAPILAAARQADKGRVAIVGAGTFYLLTHAFAEKDEKGNRFANVGESTTGPMEGIAFEKGDGKTPSDWGLLLDNLVRWAAEPTTKAGLGGKPTPWATRLKPVGLPDEPVPDFAVVNWRTQELPASWAHHSPTPIWWRGTPFYDEIPDPLVKGPQRMNRVLIGAHSAYSDGKGTVAEWAKAARAAGFAALVFTERFDRFPPERWAELVNDCRANSSSDFACLQGLDIADSYGNRFLLMGNVNFPSRGMLTDDGKALDQTARLSLGFSQHIAAVHRCGTGSLSYQLYRHFQAISVFTYAEAAGRFGLADDGFAAYQWQLDNASNPIPIVVHELYDPADAATKGTMGFQLIVPSQDALDAIRYFRYGLDHFFENPQRYFITEGPLLIAFAIFNKDIGLAELNRDHWRAILGAAAADPNALIREAILYDRGRVARRWLPNRPSFTETIDGEHGYQRHFLLVVTDSQGRRAISPHLRTVTRGYFTRCADRQNWFGAAGSYTGIWPSGTHGISYIDPLFPTPQETEQFGGKNPLATKMHFPFASNAATITGYTVDQRYLKPITYGMDAWKIENTEPSRTYEARALVTRWHDIDTGLKDYRGLVQKLTAVEATMKSKVAAAPLASERHRASAVFPVINRVDPKAAYVYDGGKQLVRGQLDGKAETVVHLPAGASIGDYLLLSPLSVTGKGEMGWKAEPGKEIPAGTEWRAAYLYVPPTDAWRAALGAAKPTPWSMRLRQGKLDSVLGTVNLAAEDYLVRGTLRAGGEVKTLPLRIVGLNEHWPAALWTPKNTSYTFSGLHQPKPLPGTDSPTFLSHIGIFEGVACATLDASADTPFFVGNTLIASDPKLVLSHTLWTAKEAGIEVHNPTDQPIRARITSPRDLPGLFRVDTRVTVPAGSSLRLSLPARR